jgi:predicted nuclease of predicted toxin-antitoxin system
MRWIVDVCLSNEISQELSSEGLQIKHWSEVGPSNAPDRVIMLWCLQHGHALITADTDFGTLLRFDQGIAPSVIILRTLDHGSAAVIPLIRDAIERFSEAIEQGCVISLDETNARIRRLPFE